MTSDSRVPWLSILHLDIILGPVPVPLPFDRRSIGALFYNERLGCCNRYVLPFRLTRYGLNLFCTRRWSSRRWDQL